MTFPSSKSHTLESEEEKEGKKNTLLIKQLALGSTAAPAPLHLPLGNKLMASANKKGTGQAYG